MPSTVALTIEKGHVVHCFAGVEIWIVKPDQSVEERETVQTDPHQPLSCARELVRHDIGVLLCTRVDVFACGFLRGNGVHIVQGCSGSAKEVLAAWRQGKMTTLSATPFESKWHGAGTPRRHRRFHGGNE